MHAITDQERPLMAEIEAVMGKLHKVSNAFRQIDNPRQPEEFKGRLRMDLKANLTDALKACDALAKGDH